MGGLATTLNFVDVKRLSLNYCRYMYSGEYLTVVFKQCSTLNSVYMVYCQHLPPRELFNKACQACDIGDAVELDSLITHNIELQNLDNGFVVEIIAPAVKNGYIDIVRVFINQGIFPVFHSHQYLLLRVCSNSQIEIQRSRLIEIQRSREEQEERRIAEQNQLTRETARQYQLKGSEGTFRPPPPPPPPPPPRVFKKKLPVQDFPAMVDFLLRANCDVNNKETICGQTPLHIAVESGTSGVIDVLLAAGADIECKNKYGRTPLHEAARTDHFEAVVKLLYIGVDVFLQDIFNNTALEVARIYRQRHREIPAIGIPVDAVLELQNETRSTIMLALVEEDLVDIATDRSETFVLAMTRFPHMEPEIISKMLENTRDSVHISTKNIDIDAIVRMVDTICSRGSL